MVLELLYNILNKYCVIEYLKLEKFEKYCNEMDHLTAAADILLQWMSTANDEWQGVCGTRDEVKKAFCDALADEDFWEEKDPPPNIIQKSTNLNLGQWWMKYAKEIQFGFEPNHC